METVVKHNGRIYIWRHGYRVEIGDEQGVTIGSRVRIVWKGGQVAFYTNKVVSIGDYNEYEVDTVLEGAFPERDGVVA